MDHVFTLKSLIDIFLHEKKKLFCAFVDFKKTFDTVWRSGLWIKLIYFVITGFSMLSETSITTSGHVDK